MNTIVRKMPIGIQSFEDLRRQQYVYVDKTALVYRLVSMGKPYFLSRPRRFGKSLLLSTLKAYFEGKKELFEGLAIAKLETQWTVRPVLHLDLNAEKYDTLENLDKQVTSQLMAWEALYGCNAADWTYFHPFLERDQSGLCTGRAANRCTHRRDGGEERHIASGSDRTDDSHVRRLSFFVKNRSKGCTTLSACSMPCSS